MLRHSLGCVLALLLLCSPVFAEDLGGGIEPLAIDGKQLYGLTWTVLPDGRVTQVGDWFMTQPETQQLAGAVYYALTNVQASSGSGVSQEDWNDFMRLFNSYVLRVEKNIDYLAQLAKLDTLTSALLDTQYTMPMYYPAFSSDGVVTIEVSRTTPVGLGNMIRVGFTYLSSSVASLGRLFASALQYHVAVPLVGSDRYAWFSALAPRPDGSLDVSDGNYRVENLLDGLGVISRSSVNGMLYLSRNLVGTDGLAAFSFLSPSEDGGLEAQDQEVDNLLDALGLVGTALQNPLAKLQYVLASDDDIELKDANKPNEDQFKEDFTGDGAAAVKPSDIGDVAGLSGGLKDSFGNTGVSAGDMFTVFGGDNFGFFSQEVADALDTVGSPSLHSDVDDSWLEAFEEDEDGFLHLKNKAGFDPTAFLRGVSE